MSPFPRAEKGYTAAKELAHAARVRQRGNFTMQDMLGQTVVVQNAASNAGQQAIDVSMLQPGTYIAWVKEGNRTVFQTKIVIIK